MRVFAVVAALTLCAASFLDADVTIRYETDLKPATVLPPALAAAFLNPAKAIGGSSSFRMKGNKGLSTSGAFTTIVDATTQEMTLIDTARKTFATIPASQFGDRMLAAMPQLPANPAVQAEAAANPPKVASKITGRTEVIQGVQAEEREITFTIDMPAFPNMPQTGPAMKIVVQIWTAKPAEALRNPAIRDLVAFKAWQKYFVNQADMMRKFAAMMPGAADSMASMFEQMQKDQAVPMRTHMDLYAPIFAALAGQLEPQPGQAPAPAMDPASPLIQVDQQVVELSTTPLDAALFEVPKDYSAVPIDDMIKSMMQAFSAGAPRQ
jgi:hypothetical protein